ncbi:hypothetical protein HMPREF1337_03096 [Enterococcus faecalis ERV65]|uniref:Uncharacterized protein n=1 Tax=Enterococcus faecalis ERV63 TaxID=1134793 RepID=A0AAV3GKR2_ENTFL|nr:MULTISPECIES: hypothetical protein [Enterococcus]EJU88113.1 hypothetical protein HMPREF1328_01932 [Enterococcus faecalis ERV103]EJU89362.1 hypothetical protein HMPREF1329_01137 [Enterococcus faecalis ERV116]EJU94875.1 hypothetical protein HMPREF1330_02395 [Enterococcus faecalis ERV129]EJU95749.1 hypothetical protein HMPREF1332_02826 [Enterococcus faecalis ERV31]EJV04564.1 hypothetical protein HMPREF1333_02303 [Enterococcus faecalis ERV37]EJV05325.1 hypothetical protein HMPREF1335_02660 [En
MRDGVGKGQHHVFKDQKALAGFGIVDVLLLFGGQIQAFRKDFSIPGRLIEQRNEVAVFKDIFNFRGGKQVVG